MRRAPLLFVTLLVLVGCSKKPPPTPAPAASVASPLTSASGGGKHEGRKDDRHEPAAPAKLTLAVAVGGEKKTWNADDFAKVPKSKGVTNDGDDRDTWSLRDMAHTLVGPTARVTAVIGDTRVVIDTAAWDNPLRIPIVHTTRRGALKFRYTNAKGKWGEADVSDVTGLEITP